jgi:nickel-dependent lactate racemase
MGDIHVKLENSWFERWKKCSRFRGQRSAIVQRLLKKLIVLLESQEEIPLDIVVSLKSNGTKKE